MLWFTSEPVLAPKGLSPRDPMWIGAWWVGFLGISIVMFGPSLALFCFPNPPQKTERRSTRNSVTSQTHDGDVKNGEVGKNRSPRKERKRSLALVDRHVPKTEHGATLVPETAIGKIKGKFPPTLLPFYTFQIYLFWNTNFCRMWMMVACFMLVSCKWVSAIPKCFLQTLKLWLHFLAIVSTWLAPCFHVLTK